MGWETREGRGRYYTRSRKVGGRVVREYVGSGLIGELAAMKDREERVARTAATRERDRQRARFIEAEGPLIDLCDLTDALVRAALVVAGYHQHHRGEWRKRREQG